MKKISILTVLAVFIAGVAYAMHPTQEIEQLILSDKTTETVKSEVGNVKCLKLVRNYGDYEVAFYLWVFDDGKRKDLKIDYLYFDEDIFFVVSMVDVGIDGVLDGAMVRANGQIGMIDPKEAYLALICDILPTVKTMVQNGWYGESKQIEKRINELFEEQQPKERV